jgi:SAM-dependent methyltransferase
LDMRSRWIDRLAARALGGLLAPPRDATIDLGHLRRLRPVSRSFGFDRGLPVDRHYIEAFLDRHRGDVRGRVLEIGDATYTRRFGGKAVTRSDVLHVKQGFPEATIVGDLADGRNIPSASFDCALITQTLHLIYDVPAAMRTLHRILKPGGVLLATFPGVSPISSYAWEASWSWGLTRRSARALAEACFAPERVEIGSQGNLLAMIAFLEGLAAEELTAAELDHADPDCEMLLTLRAVR